MATPNTNLIFVVRANGIRNVNTGQFYPFIKKEVVAGTPLTCQPNKRYFVYKALIAYSALGADVGVLVKLEGVVNQETNVLAKLVKTTAVVGDKQEDVTVQVLLDKEEPLTFTATDITTSNCLVTLAEVDDCG